MIVKSISLHCFEEKNGVKHDKVYHIEIVDVGNNKYMVPSQYGKRGKTLRLFCLTDEPVSMYEAEEIFRKKVAHERKKGYVEIPDSEELLTLVAFSY